MLKHKILETGLQTKYPKQFAGKLTTREFHIWKLKSRYAVLFPCFRGSATSTAADSGNPSQRIE